MTKDFRIESIISSFAVIVSERQSRRLRRRERDLRLGNGEHHKTSACGEVIPAAEILQNKVTVSTLLWSLMKIILLEIFISTFL